MPGRAAAALILATLMPPPAAAPADQADARLDGLFSTLKSTSDRTEGRRLTRQIRIIWRQTENEAANNALANAGWNLYQKRYEAALVLIERALDAEPGLADARP